jgi:chemotaxis protein CheX
MAEIPALLIDNLVQATADVFETMVFRHVDAGQPDAHEVVHAGPSVVATVAFAGSRCGLVSIHSSTETAREIAGAMLGMPPATINGQMPDAIGEIANMIAGTLRTRMAAHEPAWAIAVPTVTMGTDFSTKYVTDVTRLTVPFSMEGQHIFVELILTGN